MGLGRLVVIAGPDVGVEFPIPLRGGGIGRGEGNAVQLSDLAVSRTHCSLELREDRLAVVDSQSRNRTLVNGNPITVHLLQPGDEIAIGKTRLAYLPPEQSEGPAAERIARPSRVTLEIGTHELLRGHLTRTTGSGQRARRHLAGLARLGDALRRAGDRATVARVACEVAIEAMGSDRAFLLANEEGGRLVPLGSTVASGDPDGAQIAIPPDAVAKVISEGKAVALEPEAAGEGRSAVVAPLVAAEGDAPIGLLMVDRRPERVAPAWDTIDLLAAGCITHLVAAALAGVAARAALAQENQSLREHIRGGSEFIGASAGARRVLDFVGKVGPSDATVLLGGESGSGKEMVARAIHRASRRAKQPFIAVNCAALSETLLESELLGHEKGAFTGATERKLGRFELADRGSLFLDEVGELNLSCQTKFLRVLEEQVFERVGGTRAIAVDVRVIAATNRDLAEMVRRGQFREDLFYRLSVIYAVVPPLRERADDIGLLAEHFLMRLRSQVARRITGFSPEALQALAAHPWPGNVRELRNAVEYAIVLGTREVIRPEDLPPSIGGLGAMVGAATSIGHMPVATAQALDPARPTPVAGVSPIAHGIPAAAPPLAAPTAPPGTPHAAPPLAAPAQPRPLRDLERDGIIAALQATGGNKAQAAALLEIDRSTLYKKIKDYDIKT